jgi:hypothetical protein
MSQQRLGDLSAARDVHGAAWVLAALRDFDFTVGSIVPPVFEAYARVFHPAGRFAGESVVAVRWAQVADANGRTMHPAVQWGSIAGSWEQSSAIQSGVWQWQPSEGQLPWEIAQRLVAILAEHTGDPATTFFGVWEGWGIPQLMSSFSQGTPDEVQRQARDAHDAEVAAWRELLARAAVFQVPERPMHLLQGPLAAIEDFYEFCRDPPSLWWPADARWCVGTDIDLVTTYVGGSTRAIEALLADEQLEAMPVSDDQSITWEADTINPLPDLPY